LSGLSSSGTLFDHAVKLSREAEINVLMEGASFWNNQEQAQKLVGELRVLKASLKPLDELKSGADDLAALVELADEDESGELDDEVRTALADLHTKLDAAELQASMASAEDAGSAYMTIQAGEGGNDAADFAEMLLRMYLRWCETKGYKAEVIDRSEGEEAGIRNASLHIKGDYAFGFLKGETGNHRL
jgi:peptide chain release factor 2